MGHLEVLSKAGTGPAQVLRRRRRRNRREPESAGFPTSVVRRNSSRVPAAACEQASPSSPPNGACTQRTLPLAPEGQSLARDGRDPENSCGSDSGRLPRMPAKARMWFGLGRHVDVVLPSQDHRVLRRRSRSCARFRVRPWARKLRPQPRAVNGSGWVHFANGDKNCAMRGASETNLGESADQGRSISTSPADRIEGGPS